MGHEALVKRTRTPLGSPGSTQSGVHVDSNIIIVENALSPNKSKFPKAASPSRNMHLTAKAKSSPISLDQSSLVYFNFEYAFEPPKLNPP